jgi:homoprotocatechuate degradation regulator HpaR
MMLYRALDNVMPRFRRIFNEFGLTEQQWRVLRVLWEQDEIALRELADLTLIPAPSLVGIVDRLKSAGLVSRRRSESDRRVLYVLATSAGKALEKQVRPKVDAAYAELRGSLDDASWDRLLSGLEQVSHVEQDNQSTAANQ